MPDVPSTSFGVHTWSDVLSGTAYFLHDGMVSLCAVAGESGVTVHPVASYQIAGHSVL